ncbi:MAG: hypothetical protein ACJ74O_18750 [Frankiaceae bacterium]
MPADDVLAAAAEAVRHDLEATGAWTAAAARALDHGLAHRRWWLTQWPDGAPHVPGLLAQDVQDAVHETADDRWPRCPEHPDHPLLVEPDLGPDPFWVCHRTGLPVAQVGDL